MTIKQVFRITWLVGIALGTYMLGGLVWWYGLFLLALAVITHVVVEESRGRKDKAKRG